MKRIIAAIICAASCVSLTGCELDISNSGNGGNGATAGTKKPAASEGVPDTGDGDGDSDIGYAGALDGIEIYFLDVGQADCTLIHDDKHDLDILIDGGNRGDANDMIAFFEYLGIDDIDIMIATHPHEDHIGGLPAVISAFDIGTIYMPYVEEKHMPTTKIYEQFLTAIADNNIDAVVPEEGEMLYDDYGLRIECLYDGHLGTDDYNTYSIVAKASYGDIDIMLTGDADREVEDYVLAAYSSDKLDCEILKAGHHGSRTASSAAWLKAVSPEIATIPCETGNSYGHPHAETMKNLRGFGVEILDMREYGTIMISTDGLDYDVFTGLTGEYPLGSADYKGEILLP